MKGGDPGKWSQVEGEAKAILKLMKGVRRTGEVLVHAGRIIHLLQEIEEGIVQKEKDK